MKEYPTPRRQFLKIGGAALAMIPIMLVSGQAHATKNVSLRTSLKYQDKPENDKSCAKCMQFVPSANANSMGGCKIIVGDTEISPQGYCSAWAKKP